MGGKKSLSFLGIYCIPPQIHIPNIESSHSFWKNEVALFSDGQTISTTVELNFWMHCWECYWCSGGKITTHICLHPLCHCDCRPDSHISLINSKTVFYKMSLKFGSVLWKTQVEPNLAQMSQTSGHCHQRPGQHSTEPVAKCLFMFLGKIVVFGLFLHRWDQTQYLSVWDSLTTLRLLALLYFSTAGHWLG